jgi:hypothetical protein
MSLLRLLRRAVLILLVAAIVWGIGLRIWHATVSPLASEKNPVISGSGTWQEVAPGFARRTIKQLQPEHIELTLFRFAPSRFRFDLLVSSTAQDITQWMTQASSSLLVANAVYFHEDHFPSGLVSLRGTRYGKRAFNEKKSGVIAFASSTVVIVDTAKVSMPAPSTDMTLMQSYPFLVKAGFASVTEDSHQFARRTFLGKDREGFFYLGIVSDWPLSLYQLSHALPTLGIAWDDVINLDGGPSTAVAWREKDSVKTISGLSPIPLVLTVTPLLSSDASHLK